LENTTSISPAEVVITAFGGVHEVARILGRHPTAIGKWRWSREKRGTGGEVPSSAQRVLLNEAKKRGIPLNERDVIWGRGTEIHTK
jgi:hypothetical protein